MVFKDGERFPPRLDPPPPQDWRGALYFGIVITILFCGLFALDKAGLRPDWLKTAKERHQESQARKQAQPGGSSQPQAPR
jgi:hypothetical protein